MKPLIKKFYWLANIGIRKERDYLIENLSMLLDSGMGITDALSAAREELVSKRMREIVGGVQNKVEAGLPLWQALEESLIFPAHIIALVRIGEESGSLSENLRASAAQEAKERLFRSKIRSALAYPVLLLSFTIVVSISLAWFILPRLAFVFSQLRLELPLITKILIWAGEFLQQYGWIIIPVFILILLRVIYSFFYFKRTKYSGQVLFFYLPGVKRLIQEIELSRFGFMLGTLLQAGLPITEALDSLGKATVFPAYRKFYYFLKEKIEEGVTLQQSFHSYPRIKSLLPVPVQQMIVSGEQSGNLAEILFKIGDNFENKTDLTAKNLAVILEPLLLVVVWLGVVAVALAVILPIYQLVGGISTTVR